MSISYQLCEWNDFQQQLIAIRTEVFVLEQNVPKELEIDGLDAQCKHVIALLEDKNDAKNTQAIATARLLKDGHIGRMCVLKAFRNQGIATQLLKLLINEAQKAGIKTVKLNAQTTAIAFYQKMGFNVCSDIFLDAGIKHQSMQLVLTE